MIVQETTKVRSSLRNKPFNLHFEPELGVITLLCSTQHLLQSISDTSTLQLKERAAFVGDQTQSHLCDTSATGKIESSAWSTEGDVDSATYVEHLRGRCFAGGSEASRKASELGGVVHVRRTSGMCRSHDM